MGQLSVIVFSDVEESGTAIVDHIERLGHARTAHVVSDEGRLDEEIASRRPDVLIAELGRAPQATLERIAQIGATGPAVVAIGPTEDSRFILRAFQMGVREYIPEDSVEQELPAALEKLMGRTAAPASTSHRAPVVAVMGAKGGVGATFVACQLAAALQKNGGSTAVVDLNFPIGDVALHFDLRPAYTLASLAGKGEFDLTFLQSVLHRHPSGLGVLAAPERVEQTELVRGDHVERAVRLLRDELAWVVVDVSRSWNEPSVRVLDLADQILLVTSLDLAAVSHTRQHLDLLRRLGHAPDRIHLVANRHTGKESLTRSDFASFVGREPEVILPNDYATAVEAVNTGRALGDFAGSTALNRAYRDLARTAHGWCGLDGDGSDRTHSLSGRLRRMFRR